MFPLHQFCIGHGFLFQSFELIIVGCEFVDLLLQLHDSILQSVECWGSDGGVVETLLKSLSDTVHDLGDTVQLGPVSISKTNESKTRWMGACVRLTVKETYLPLDGLDLSNVQHCYKMYTCAFRTRNIQKASSDIQTGRSCD